MSSSGTVATGAMSTRRSSAPASSSALVCEPVNAAIRSWRWSSSSAATLPDSTSERKCTQSAFAASGSIAPSSTIHSMRRTV